MGQRRPPLVVRGHPESVPARRMYNLTKAGEIFLSGWIDALQNYQQALRNALEGLTPPAPIEAAEEAPKRQRRA